MATGDHPICRWDCDGILVDIMPIDKKVFGFSNKWYKEALAHSTEVELSAKISLNIISAPYFLVYAPAASSSRKSNRRKISLQDFDGGGGGN